MTITRCVISDRRPVHRQRTEAHVGPFAARSVHPMVPGRHHTVRGPRGNGSVDEVLGAVLSTRQRMSGHRIRRHFLFHFRRRRRRISGTARGSRPITGVADEPMDAVHR